MAKLVVLDPGHSYTSVNQSPDGSYFEWEFAQDVCNKAAAMIKQISGIECMLTKRADEILGVSGRVAVANNNKADLFLSQHSNALTGGWSSTNGFGVYRYPGRNLTLARIGLKWSEELLDMRSRGILERNLYVINPAYIKCPSILFETGFHTNREDVAKLKTQEFRAQQAKVLVRTSCEYLGVKYVEEDLSMATEFYPVKRGDNLGRIASSYELTLAKLREFNPQIEDANKIEVDELVFVAQPERAEIVYAAYIRTLLHGETQYGLQLEQAQAALKEEQLKTASAISEANELRAAGKALYGSALWQKFVDF